MPLPKERLATKKTTPMVLFLFLKVFVLLQQPLFTYADENSKKEMKKKNVITIFLCTAFFAALAGAYYWRRNRRAEKPDNGEFNEMEKNHITLPPFEDEALDEEKETIKKRSIYFEGVGDLEGQEVVLDAEKGNFASKIVTDESDNVSTSNRSITLEIVTTLAKQYNDDDCSRSVFSLAEQYGAAATYALSPQGSPSLLPLINKESNNNVHALRGLDDFSLPVYMKSSRHEIFQKSTLDEDEESTKGGTTKALVSMKRNKVVPIVTTSAHFTPVIVDSNDDEDTNNTPALQEQLSPTRLMRVLLDKGASCVDPTSITNTTTDAVDCKTVSVVAVAAPAAVAVAATTNCAPAAVATSTTAPSTPTNLVLPDYPYPPSTASVLEPFSDSSSCGSEVVLNLNPVFEQQGRSAFARSATQPSSTTLLSPKSTYHPIPKLTETLEVPSQPAQRQHDLRTLQPDQSAKTKNPVVKFHEEDTIITPADTDYVTSNRHVSWGIFSCARPQASNQVVSSSPSNDTDTNASTATTGCGFGSNVNSNDDGDTAIVPADKEDKMEGIISVPSNDTNTGAAFSGCGFISSANNNKNGDDGDEEEESAKTDDNKSRSTTSATQYSASTKATNYSTSVNQHSASTYDTGATSLYTNNAGSQSSGDTNGASFTETDDDTYADTLSYITDATISNDDDTIDTSDYTDYTDEESLVSIRTNDPAWLWRRQKRRLQQRNQVDEVMEQRQKYADNNHDDSDNASIDTYTTTDKRYNKDDSDDASIDTYTTTDKRYNKDDSDNASIDTYTTTDNRYNEDEDTTYTDDQRDDDDDGTLETPSRYYHDDGTVATADELTSYISNNRLGVSSSGEESSSWPSSKPKKSSMRYYSNAAGRQEILSKYGTGRMKGAVRDKYAIKS